jgi:DNA topoisomerase-1
MTDAKTENTTVSIDNDKNKITLTARQEVVLFEGFLKAYVVESDDEDEEGGGSALLPPMNIGEILPLNVLTATEKFSKHPPRYNEASLVKKLEELGIGRPSTYAPTISTIQNRDYVIKDSRDGKKVGYRVVSLKNDKIETLESKMVVGAEKNKLFPTDIGMLVTDFLTQYFDKVVDFKFTAKIEEEFDKISHGKLEWTKMLKTFYDPFQLEVEKTIETAERVSGERVLGNHPDTGEVILVRMGRFGPMAQIGLTEEGEGAKKPRYAKLKREQNIETLTIEEALELFRLPRVLGQFEDKDVKVNIGRFGPYIQHNSGFISLKKEDDPYTIDLDLAIQRIEDKRTADANKIIKDFSEHGFQILNGRWGPYIKMGSDNYKIPKTENAETLSLDKCLELIESQKDAPKKKGKFTRRK